MRNWGSLNREDRATIKPFIRTVSDSECVDSCTNMKFQNLNSLI